MPQGRRRSLPISSSTGPGRVGQAPVGFRIVVQVAEEGDVLDDATARWPESRELVLEELTLTKVAADNAAAQRQIIFDPVPRVDGIAASADPS